MNIVDAFEQVKAHLQGECLADVAEKCNVSPGTLRNWRDNKVKYPRVQTFTKIAGHYGYELTMVRKSNAVHFSAAAHSMVLYRTGGYGHRRQGLNI